MQSNHYIIIMAGGIGSRFWPMSRSSFPKQFHDILGTGRTLIQSTYDRFRAFIPAENIYVVTNQRYYDLTKKQLPGLSDDQILLEPIGRNTAPCIAYASYKISKQNPNAVFVVSPADHLISDVRQFQRNIELGLLACSQEEIIMTLGITPTRPDTGYGYIQFLDDQEEKGYYKVKTFTEKPTLEIAETFLASGDFVWNSGIFLFSSRAIINGFQELLPDMAELFSELTPVFYTPGEADEINRVYGTCKNISIDYGIMEKASNVHVIPSEFGWSDLGTWGSVYENSETDYFGNAVKGKVMIYHARNNIIRSSNPDKMVVLHGLDGFIVVDTGDALLICRKEEEQSIREIVGELRSVDDGAYV